MWHICVERNSMLSRVTYRYIDKLAPYIFINVFSYMRIIMYLLKNQKILG